MSEGPRPGTATPDAAGAEPWRALVASLPDGVVVLDARGVLRELNSAFCALVGHPPDGLIGRGPPFQWVGAASQEPFEELIGRGLRGEAASAEITVVDAGGRTRTASVRAASFVSPEHGRSAALMFTDVTERKSLETTQRDSERRWRSIVENPFQFVVVIDRSYRYVFVNHVEPGIHLEELLGKATPFDFVEREFHALMKAALDKAFREGVTTTYDVYSPVLDQWTSNIVGPIFEGAEVTSLSILVRDTTAAKRAELALRRSQKLEMLGAMGSSIVGDLRGLLAPVVGNVGAMLREMEEQHPLFTRLSEVSRAISKASELMNRLEPFQREPADATESVNVAAIAADVLSRAFAASPDIRLSIDIAEDCPRVVGFPWQMQQALENLLDNARRALAAGGEVFVSVSKVAVESRFATLHDMRAGPAVKITVSDTGRGMSAETLARAFEPFFTTWKEQGCVGLGLPMVQAIATRHGGAVTARPGPGQGTTVELYLPGASGPAQRPKHASGNERRVLCIDDEGAVLKLTRRVLERAGHVVTTLQEPLEALERLKASPNAFDIVITDQIMPRLTGVELAEQMLVIAPDLPFLLVSGFCDPDIVTPVNVRAFLQKPVPVETLLEEVETCAKR